MMLASLSRESKEGREREREREREEREKEMGTQTGFL
jgi:hypothetical protein